jgi:branched-chain amino acid transport system substrate-binding protein
MLRKGALSMKSPASRTSAVIFAVVLLTAVSACGDDAAPEDEAADDATTTTAAPEIPDRGNVDGVLQVGHLAPQTGPMAAIVSSVTEAVRIGVEEINAAGGVNGEPVELTVADDGADPAVAATALDQLIESDGVDAVFGPATSASALAVIDKIRTAGVLDCSGSATAADLSTVDSGGYFFRTAPPDGFQGPALAELVLRDDNARVGIIARNDAYGIGLADSAQEALVASGAAAAGDVIAYDPAGTDFESDVQALVDQTPDSVILIGFSDDGARVLRTMIQAGFGPADVPIYTTDGLQTPSLAAGVDPDDPAVLVGIRGTAPAAVPGGVDSPFYAAFGELGIPPIFSAYYYDCTMLTVLAAQAAGTDDAAAMKDAFAGNLAGETDCNTYADCLAVLEDGGTIHYRGASASFDEWNGFEPAQGVYDVWSYDETGAPVTGEAEDQITIQ